LKAKLKICGITRLDDALASIDCGADYLGFNFYPQSPRYLSPDDARSIIEKLPDGVTAVGIFVNRPSPEEVLEIMYSSGVGMAQLHGDESVEYCRRVGAGLVIRALRTGPGFEVDSVLDYPAAAILLDAFDNRLYGGTGRVADWSTAAQAAKKVRLFLAGGLSPENIAEAIRAVEPFAVDVNSGVESAPGVKDHQKLKELREEMKKL